MFSGISLVCFEIQCQNSTFRADFDIKFHTNFDNEAQKVKKFEEQINDLDSVWGRGRERKVKVKTLINIEVKSFKTKSTFSSRFETKSKRKTLILD